MPQVLSNRRISRDFYLMRVAQPNDARMGQFCMLRAWGRYPLLSRPVSVFDADAGTLSFLYRVIGEGTELLSRRREGDAVETGRVLGNAFPLVSGRVALVGGGAGIAPLYLAARTLGAYGPATAVDLYLGFSDEVLLAEEYRAVGDRTTVKVTSGTKLYVSLEKRMACGFGACLACSCGTTRGRRKVCTDGPVFPAEEVF